ncbi:MAG: hypothetical protein ABIQ35_06745 [Verrucomicrobiota bacterium]
MKRVQQISFHGPSALDHGQSILYVMERVVFKLEPEGLELCELAPGIGARNVLSLIEFMPATPAIRRMPAECFQF